jgi:hypothetical protein
MVNKRVPMKLLVEAGRTLIVCTADGEAEERVRVKVLFQEATGPILR